MYSEHWRLGVWHPTEGANELKEDALCIRAETIADGLIPGPVCIISPVSNVTPLDVERTSLILAAPLLKKALEKLVHLHACEQEGIESGQPTPEEWFKAVEEAQNALTLSETPPQFSKNSNYGIEYIDRPTDHTRG